MVEQSNHAPFTIEILICTFRRPFLRQTLESLARQVLLPELQIAVIVADNDTTPSAQPLVEEVSQRYPHRLIYLHAPERNISVARNACLAAASAPWVAFLDDDELAPPHWISSLWQAVRDTGADAIFATARAVYPPGTPDWITEFDYHTNVPQRRGGRVLTGHTCNAILRWQGTAWQDQRFELTRGRSGGEDTAFFFAIARKGARFEATDSAEVTEPVAAGRLNFAWLARRKFRAGQSHASSENTGLGKFKLGLSSLCKAGYCAACALLRVFNIVQRNYWILRGTLHLGVVAGCLALPEPRAYGH